MFEKFFRDLIVDSLGNYIEDFTHDDIQIDNWNGVVVKESCVVKQTALQSLMRSLVGAPVIVKTGFVRKIRINIPWSEILSKPCEVYLDDVHVICLSPAGFNTDFMQKSEHKGKLAMFEELLKQFREQQAKEETKQAEDIKDKKEEQNKEKESELSESYISRLKKIIKENLRFSLQNIHLRFEDTLISRAEKSFNLGLTLDKIIYSSTNNRFERVFLNIDDKKSEKRSFALLEIQQMALYWNTNAHDNWTSNPEFVNLDCQKTIDFSKKYTENLKRKYHQFQQNLTQNQVYVIQPLDFQIKFRSNLNQKAQPMIPLSTQNYEISQLLITLDEEIYKDMQYLTKFWSWHASAVKKERKHFKFRPDFNVPVKNNARKYWHYAIKSTIHYLRKHKNKTSGHLRQKRQQQTIELCVLYKLKAFNTWIKANYSEKLHKDHLLFKVDTQQNQYTLKDTEDLEQKIFSLECKLTPEQMVVAFTKAETEADQMIRTQKEQAGWSNWLSSSVMSIIGYGNKSTQDGASETSEQKKEEQDIHELMHKLKEFETSETSSAINVHAEPLHSKQDHSNLDSHKTLSIPIIQFALVNKSMHQFGSKQFMMVVIQDVFVQSLSAKKDNYSNLLWSIKNFEIIDRLLNQQKFSRMIQKKDSNNDRSAINQQRQNFGARIQNQINRKVNALDESLSEIEEEMNPNVNNGMQQIQDYNRIKSSLEQHQQFFLVMQLVKKSIKRQAQNTKEVTLVRQYHIDLVITNLQIFYNRVLLSRFESFMNQARINRVQNAQAEAEYNDKLEQFKQETEKKMMKTLEKSEINLNCNLKSIEILAPDNINYELSKFLILQTGDIHVRSGESKRLNLYYGPNCSIDKQIQKELKNSQESQEEYREVVTMSQVLNVAEGHDKYSFMVYDFKVLYIPTVDQLENYMYNDTFLADIDLKHSILKKLDIIAEYHTGISIEAVDKTSQSSLLSLAPNEIKTEFKMSHVKIGIGCVDIRLTNKEIQQLKDFQDNIIKYHDQINFEIDRELKQIQKFNMTTEIIHQASSPKEVDEVSDTESTTKLADLFAQAAATSRRKSSLNLSVTHHEEDEFHDAPVQMHTSKASEGDFDDDEFFDAQDYFEPGLIFKVATIRSAHEKEHMVELQHEAEEQKKAKEVKKKHKNLVISLSMPKFKLTLLEAQDFEKEIMRGLKERIGGSFIRGLDTQLLDIDMKLKGLPFLQFEMNTINLRVLQNKDKSVIGFFIKDIGLMNIEKRESKSILYSANNDIFDTHIRNAFNETPQATHREKNHKTMGPEEEDEMIRSVHNFNLDDEDQYDNFLSVIIMSSSAAKKTIISVGQTQLDFNDTLIRRIYESILQDMPESQISKYREAQQLLQKEKIVIISEKISNLEFKWHGLNALIRDKKDSVLIKLVDFKVNTFSDPEADLKETKVSLRDFQVIQEDYEIILKHHGATDDLIIIDESLEDDSFDKLLIQFNQTNTETKKSQEITVSDFMFIVDFKSLIKIVSIGKSYESQIQHVLKDSSNRSPKKETVLAPKGELKDIKQSFFKLAIKNSFVQLPSREGKNSLFFQVQDLIFNTLKHPLTNRKETNICSTVLQVFVACQFDQQTKYNLLAINDLSLRGINGSQKIKLQEVKITLNENYILLISKLLDENFDDCMVLIQKLQKEKTVTIEDQRLPQEIDQNKPQQTQKDFNYPFLELFELQEIKQTLDLLKFNPNEKKLSKDQVKFLELLLSSFKIEWVFGMSFDEHQNQYVTLNNRNVTKLILEQLNSQTVPDDELEQIDSTAHKVSTFLSKHRGERTSLHQIIEPQSSANQLISNHSKLTIEFKNTGMKQFDIHTPENPRGDQARIFKVQDHSINYTNDKKCSIPIIQLSSVPHDHASIEILVGADVSVMFGRLSILVCQQNMETVSDITKSVYSCKNVVYKGRRRMLLAKFFSKNEKKDSQISDVASVNKVTRFKLSNLRVIIFDSSNMMKETLKKSNLSLGKQDSEMRDFEVDGIIKEDDSDMIDDAVEIEHQKFFKDQFTPKLLSPDSIVARNSFMINFSLSVVITKSPEWIKSQYEQDIFEKGLNKITLLKLKGLEVYQNNFLTTLAELMKIEKSQPMQKLMILHPSNVFLKSAAFEQEKNFPDKSQTDIEISTTEVEVSLKQLFKLKLLSGKITDKMQPINSILEHINKKSKQDSKEVKPQKQIQHKQLTIKLCHFYMTLIKEISDSSIISAGEQSNERYLMSQYAPIFSLECKNIKLISQKQSDAQIDKMRVQIPLEVYYFNTSLNFFEPFIEKTLVEITVSKTLNIQKVLKLDIKELLNLNFSVALYDSIFNLQSTLKQEQQIYEQLKQAYQQQQTQTSNSSLKKPKINKEIFAASSYFIKNQTGELLMFKTSSQKAFQELQPDEEYPIDFQMSQQLHHFDNLINQEKPQGRDKKNKEILRQMSINAVSIQDEDSDDTDLSDSMEHYSQLDDFEASVDDSDFEINKSFHHLETKRKMSGLTEEMQEFKMTHSVAKSIFRRRNYKFLKIEPKKVFFQILVQQGADLERTSVFEVNVDSQACQKIFLDEHKEFYIICQTQQSDGKKHLIVRSPMQIVNNLQIPVEIILSNSVGSQSSQVQAQEEGSTGLIKTEYTLLGNAMQHEMLIKPESSVNIPLRACGFKQIQLCPKAVIKRNFGSASSGALSRADKKFEWTQKAEICLMKDESEIFEQKPVILASKLLRKNTSVERNNNKIFMVLNTNTYSIRSYVDFNTQQTEFISMKYISISPPFVFQNLVPAPISLFFKNITRKISSQNREFTDPQLFDLDIKHNSQQQILFLNPLGNFELSMVIPGFEQTNFVQFKTSFDEDHLICQQLKKKIFRVEDNEQDQDVERNLFHEAKFRFLVQKKMLFQLVSLFQNQFNICANIAFVQGQYHITFYSKYWFLNNTLMPLDVQIKTKTYNFERMSLPFENRDFDFDTIKKFADLDGKEDDSEKGGKMKRKNSNDTIITLQEQTPRGSTKYESVGDNISVKSNNMKKYEESQVNFKSLLSAQTFNHSSRVKPWEVFRLQEQENVGLLGLLTQQDIDSVQTVFFTQEEYKDENKSERTGTEHIHDKLSAAGSHREQRMLSALKRSSADINKIDQQTMMSKTSIQMIKFQEQIDSQEAVPLIHTELSNIELYPAPLKDKSQLKRVVLFSDNPSEDYESQQVRQPSSSNKENILDQSMFEDMKKISLKICDSQWTDLPLDETRLQGESILLKDKLRKFCSNSMYEIVANVQYLPHPFSFSKIIEFKPRYMVVNKTYSIIQIIQAECEEKGVFKAYPAETSVFHWTDSTKPQEINVRFEEHEYSGNIRIDGIGEINLRLRGQYQNDSIILSVSISEERNTLFIVFNDVSYAPPYRIENLTKTSFKIQQVNSRADDFDVLRPFQIIPYAWSYPLNEKLLKISLCSSSSQETNLGSFKIDQINKLEKIMLQDKKTERQFLLEIINEKSIKVIRISYTDEFTQNQAESILQTGEKLTTQILHKYKVNLSQFGISIINSQARELAYAFLKNFNVAYEKQENNIKFQVRLEDFQFDNQLVRKREDEIIIKRDLDVESQDLSSEYFLNLKIHFLRNEAIDNLYFFKYFYLMIIPFNLNLDGNFCDELFRYGSDIVNQTKKYKALDKNRELEYYSKDMNEIDKIKKAFDDLKKPYDQGRELQAQKKVYFEEFYVHDIKMKFTFSSSPIMFREFSMNPTLKFLIVLMSSLKNVRLRFSSFQLQQQQQLMSIFTAQLKRHYLQQCYNHKQILQLVTSMGLFGNINESLSNLHNAIESLVYHPFHEANIFKGIAIGGAIFVKSSISAIYGPVHSIFESFKSGATYLLQYGQNYGQIDQENMEKQNFDDDFEEVSKDLNNYGTPLSAIDTQNRIWLKIITKELKSTDIKRLHLKKRQGEIEDQKNREVGQQELTHFYRRQNVDQQGGLASLIKDLVGSITYLPRRLLQDSAKVIDNMNTRLKEEETHKVRPPRFTSFTMQLEAYSLKKAFALQILNDINLNMLQTETIQKLFTLEHHVVIFTAKRIICVQEVTKFPEYTRQIIIGRNNGNNPMFENRDKDPELRVRVGKSSYTHWNIFFSDILKLKLQFIQKSESRDVYNQEARIIDSREEQLQTLKDSKNLSNLIFILRILFTLSDHSPSSKIASDSLISDFRICHKDISIEQRDLPMLKRIYKEIFKRSDQSNM